MPRPVILGRQVRWACPFLGLMGLTLQVGCQQKKFARALHTLYDRVVPGVATGNVKPSIVGSRTDTRFRAYISPPAINDLMLSGGFTPIRLKKTSNRTSVAIAAASAEPPARPPFRPGHARTKPRQPPPLPVECFGTQLDTSKLDIIVNAGGQHEYEQNPANRPSLAARLLPG
jgi:hypothetical protein